jgi:hypothetical protein
MAVLIATVEPVPTSAPASTVAAVPITAEVLGVHPETVNRDWRRAKAFLLRELAAR